MFCHTRPRSLRPIPFGTTPPMHTRDGDPAHAKHAEMSNLTILPCRISLLQTRACRASAAAVATAFFRPLQPATRADQESGARHPHASPRLGRASSARGHTEREEPGVKGRRAPRPRARQMTCRAGRETLWRTECARRTMIPKIVPQFERGEPRGCGRSNPFDVPDRKFPRRSDVIVRDDSAGTRYRRPEYWVPPRSRPDAEKRRPSPQEGPPLRVCARVTRCRRPCRRRRGSRRSCRPRRGRSSWRSRRHRRGPCR